MANQLLPIMALLGASWVTVLWLALFVGVLVGGFSLFLVIEAIALARKDDELHTLSTYIKRARRRHPVAGFIVLSTAIFAPAAWLWGHLVMEWW